MGRVRRTIFIYSHICIAVISYYKYIVALFAGRSYNCTRTLINRFYSFLNCFIHPGMSYHVAIGEVKADKIELPCFDCLNNSVPYTVSAHLGLQVVCRNLWRRDHYTLFAGKFLLPSSREKEGDMCIFLCFGNPQLLFTGSGKYLAYCITGILFRVDDMKPFESSIIRSHCAIEEWDCFHSVLRHILLGKDNSELLGPVVPEVKEDNDITLFYCSDRVSIIIGYNQGLHELISDALIV